MQLSDECKGCLFNSQLKKAEREQTDKLKLKEFVDKVRALCANPPKNYCAPLLMRDIDRAYAWIVGTGLDYSEEKAMFDNLLLKMEDKLFQRVISADDCLSEALKFCMAANFIDFARLADLNAESVEYVLSSAARAVPDAVALLSLKNKLETAKTLCFLHDNCGEIVLDKILIRLIKQIYPGVAVTSVVRGGAIINDVTIKDAKAVGLYEFADVIGNGTAIPGTYLKEVSKETLEVLGKSDIIISKGLGNLETLYGEGYNVFYMFTCKCEHIADRFGVSLWSAVLTEEK